MDLRPPPSAARRRRPLTASGRVDAGEEALHVPLQAMRLLGQALRGLGDPLGGRSGLSGGIAHVAHLLRHFPGSGRGLLGVAGHLPGSSPSVPRRPRKSRPRRGRISPIDREIAAIASAVPEETCWIVSICWGDLVRRLAGLGRQVLDLRGDDGKALARLAGARRLDRGIQRQQVGLLSDVLDQGQDAADPLGRLDQPLDRPRRCVRRG